MKILFITGFVIGIIVSITLAAAFIAVIIRNAVVKRRRLNKDAREFGRDTSGKIKRMAGEKD